MKRQQYGDAGAQDIRSDQEGAAVVGHKRRLASIDRLQ
jgi:hypothetical protein